MELTVASLSRTRLGAYSPGTFRALFPECSSLGWNISSESELGILRAMKRAEILALVERADAVTMAIHERTIGLRRLQDQIVTALNRPGAEAPVDRRRASSTDADSFHFRP